jgi:hypothetical protein
MSETALGKFNSRAICVLGMHRSGTSVLTGLLGLLGVDLGRDLMPGGNDNPNGFWEHGHIVSVHIGLMHEMGTYYGDILPLPAGWEFRQRTTWYRDNLLGVLDNEFSGKPLWGFKDPRACLLVPMWNRLFDAMRTEPGFVLMLRHPDEVAMSMQRRDQIDYTHVLLLWVLHMLEAERNTRGRRRVIVSYDQLMTDWRGTIDKIAAGVEVQWPRSPEAAADRVAKFLNPVLRHERTQIQTPEQAIAQRGCDPTVARWALTMYDALAAAADDPQSQPRTDLLDQVQAEFNRAMPNLMAIRPAPPKSQRFVNEYHGMDQVLYRAG